MKIFLAKVSMLCYGEKMLQFFNQKYLKFQKKIIENVSGKILKIIINFILLIYWSIIVFGTIFIIN